MTDPRRPITLLATVALVLAACGGGGSAATAAPGGGAATSSPTQASTPEAPSAPTSGGGTAAGVCELVTADELAEIFGVPSVTTTVFVGPPDSCTVESDTGKPMAAWSLTTAGAKSTYDMFALPAQSVDVPGIGDEAAFVENTGLLVLKGDSLLVIGLMTGVGDLSQDEQNDIAKKIGAAAAGRM